MHQQINFNDFCNAFHGMGRDNQFSYEGKRALFDYLEAYAEDTGTSVELDIVALCCDYTEASYEEIARDYRIDVMGDNEECKGEVQEYLDYHTAIAGEVPGGFVFANF